MKDKRLLRLVSLLVLMALVLAGCDKPCPDCPTGTEAQALPYLQMDKALVRHEMTNLGYLTVGDGEPDTAQTEGSESLYVEGTVEAGDTAYLDGAEFTLGAAEKVLVDGATTANTGTAGLLDINAATITADVSAVNVAMTQNDGATAGEDAWGQIITLTGNDANGDVFGLKIEGAATTNAAAGTYEYLASLVCSENTAGACPDALLVTAGATDTSVTDGVDVSDSEIVNAINIGFNNIKGGDELFTIGATDDTVLLTRSESGAGTYTCADNDANAECVFAGGGTGKTSMGTTSNTSAQIYSDGTGDAELVVPNDSIGEAEINQGTSGQVLMSSATPATAWQSISGDVSLAGDGAATVTQINGAALGTTTATDTNILVADGTNWDSVTMSGDVTIANDGTASIASGVIVNDDVNTSAAIAYSKLAAMTAANILVGNVSNVATVVNPAGDVEFANDGTTSIEAGVIVNADINASAAISATKIADGTVTNAEFQYIGGLTSDAQTQIDGKEATITENSIGPDDVAVMHDDVVCCGQADESGTVFLGPALTLFGGGSSAITYTISAAGCDALGDATEATADAPLFTNVAFKVTGLYCKQSGTLGAGESITFTIRSAEADLTPSVYCIVGEGETDCRSLTGSTTDVAAGATIAVETEMTSDNADDDVWCRVYLALK